MPITLIDELGEPRTIDESEVPAAEQAGWRPETPQEEQARFEALKYGTFGEEAKGLAEQGLSGATLGLSDVALAGVGGDPYREAAAARARQLGAAGTAAKVAGAVAPLLLTGGESAPATLAELGGAGVRVVGAPVRAAAALGRAGEAVAGTGLRGLGLTGESILGRGVLKGTELAVGGGIEGGIYGAGQALSESALAPGGNYDHLAEKLFAGAEEGAKFGFLTGGGLGFLGGAGSRAIERGAQKLVGPEGLKSLLQRTSDEATIRAVGGMSAKEASIAGESGTTRMASELKATVLDDGTRLVTPGASKEVIAERLNRAVPETGAKLGGLRRELSDSIEASGRHELRPELGDFFTAVDGMVAEAETGPRALLKRAEKARREVDGLRSLYAKGEATLEDVASYRQKLDTVLRPPTKGGGLQVAAKNAAELEQVRGMLEKSITDSVDRGVRELMPGREGEYQALKQRYAALKDAQKLATRAVGREMVHAGPAPVERVTGAIGVIGSIAHGGIAPLAATTALSAANRLWRSRGDSVLAVLADRAARVESGNRGAIKGYLQRLRLSATGQAAAHEVEQKGRIERVLKQRAAETAQKAYARRLNQIVNFTPDKASGFNELAAAAPQTASSAAALMTRAKQYLLQTAPTHALDTDPLQPQLLKPNPDPVMLEKWARRVEAAQDPVGTLKKGLTHGSLTKEHVETMKAIYPELFQSFRSALSDELLQTKERLPYMERVKLGVLFEIPTDKALEPRNLARTQAMYAAKQQAPAPTPPPIPDTSNTMAAHYSSESQRLEANIPPM